MTTTEKVLVNTMISIKGRYPKCTFSYPENMERIDILFFKGVYGYTLTIKESEFYKNEYIITLYKGRPEDMDYIETYGSYNMKNIQDIEQLHVKIVEMIEN